MRRLYDAADLPQAQLLVDHLATEGIPARIFNTNAQGGLGEIPFINAYPQVWVDDEGDFSRARAVVERLERPAPETAARSCHACGEENPGAFEVCWACGAELTDGSASCA